MIRLANNVNGFFEANTTNMRILSHSKYPKQNTSYIGKWTAIRYKSEYNNLSRKVYYTDGTRDIFRRGNRYFYDDEYRMEVPEYDRDGNKIHITEKFTTTTTTINNRHIIDKRYYPELTASNSGITTFFQILRYDIEYPNKVILRSDNNEVIVMKREDFIKIYDLDNSDILKKILSKAKVKGVDYISPNITTSRNIFFKYYNDEYINTYPIQNDELLGRLVFTEYESDIFDTSLTFEDNQMDKYTLKDNDHNRVIEKDGKYYYSDKTDEEVPLSKMPIRKELNNQFPFTQRMADNLIKNRREVYSYPDEQKNSFIPTYNVHSHSIIDTPRRAINKGIIIRADSNSYDPYIVIAEYIGDNNVRFICSDEARIFFNTDIEGLSVNRISEVINERNIIK